MTIDLETTMLSSEGAYLGSHVDQHIKFLDCLTAFWGRPFGEEKIPHSPILKADSF